MLKKERNKGITLIALIITIIVLLILAGVTISAITGNESVMEKAKEAKEKQEASTEIEKLQLAYISAMADLEKTNITAQELEDYLNNNMNMNVYVTSTLLYHDEVSDKFWFKTSANGNELTNENELRNIEYAKNNTNVNIELEECKLILFKDELKIYIVDSKGKIKDTLNYYDYISIKTGTNSNGKNALIFIDRYLFPNEYYSVLETGVIYAYDGYDVNGSFDMKENLGFKNNTTEELRLSNTRKYIYTYTPGDSYFTWTLGVGSSVDVIIYARSYAYIENNTTHEKRIIYGDPVAVSFNRMKAIEQEN